MSRALLLLTTGLTMGATRVVSSANMLAPLGQVAHAWAGAGVSLSSEDEVSMLSMFMYPSLGGAGWTGTRWVGARWSVGLVREWDAILGPWDVY